MVRKITLLLSAAMLLLAAFPTAIHAQTDIKVQVLNLVSADEQFNLTFVIEGENAPSDFSWSPGEGLRLVWGPQKGSSTSISIVNGKRTKSAQTTYTYILLPLVTGTVVIPPATATVKGNTIHSPETRIEVVPSGASSQSQGSSGSSQGGSSRSQGSQSSGGTVSSDIPSGDLFLRLDLGRSSLVVGEPVNAVLKLYQRVNITGFEDVRFPSFNGFWSQESFTPTNIEFKRENIDDKIYNAAVLRSWTLIPQQAGEIKIDPSELVCVVAVRTASPSRSIFDSFFDDDVRTVRKRVVSQARTVKVSPLPAGAPASFGGGVGSYTLSASVSRDSLDAHEAASLVVKVSGRGNVSLLEAPKPEFPPDFDVYDVKVTDMSDKSSGRTSGAKTFEYPFIPRSAGDFVIPPVKYSYFDTASGRYVTLSTDPIPLKVGRGSVVSAQPDGTLTPAVPARSGDLVRDLGSDIRYIATARPALVPVGKFFCFSPLFWILFALIVAASAAVWFILRRLAALRSDVALTRNRGAVRMARKRLERAGSFLKEGLSGAFYEELHRALLGYVSDKLNIDMADMSRDNIVSDLEAAGVGSELAGKFASLLEECEYARYSPDSGGGAMSAHYETALSLIASIDSNMKKKSSAAPKAALTLLLAIFLLSPVSRAAVPSGTDSLWHAGVEAYAAADWDGALGSWTEISDSGLCSPDLYCNIGDAFFKKGDYARAILWYERALKLDPSCDNARYNLKYSSTFIRDRVDSVPEFFLVSAVRSLSHSLSSDVWAALFLLLLALALAGALLFLLGSGKGLKKTGFWCGIVFLLLSAACLGFSASLRAESRNADKAIVLSPVAPVKSAPGAGSSRDLFLLHEGTKVTIKESVPDWYNVSLSDGRQGWISRSDVEKI